MLSTVYFPRSSHSPFNSATADSYCRWRDNKLKNYPTKIESLIVEIKSLSHMTAAEKTKIARLCHKTNMVIYAAPSSSKREELKKFASAFGLRNFDTNPLSDKDSLSSITIQDNDNIKKHYIPYTDQSLAWHTDGYYNPLNRLVRGMILHCVTPAVIGGTSTVLDPEILYIRLRDEAPDVVEVLSRPDSMRIPAHEGIRSQRTGPVFSYNASESKHFHIHMRYTHRTRSVVWHEEAVAAAAHLRTLLDAEDVPHIFRCRLESGQGILCNNVLHARTSFHDTPHYRRLFYRARFLERISDSNLKLSIRKY